VSAYHRATSKRDRGYYNLASAIIDLALKDYVKSAVEMPLLSQKRSALEEQWASATDLTPKETEALEEEMDDVRKALTKHRKTRREVGRFLESNWFCTLADFLGAEPQGLKTSLLTIANRMIKEQTSSEEGEQ